MKKFGIPFALSLLISCLAIQGMEIDPKPIKKTLAKSSKETMKRVTLHSGLQYEILSESKDTNAKAPQKGKPVTVHYTGWLADKDGNPIMNKKFDSSVDRGAPFEFVIGVGMVIKGWDEGVMVMKVGEKRRLIIPAQLGYGARAMGEKIPANSCLVFDVELLDVK